MKFFKDIDCIWNCHDAHSSALYSLTRTIDEELLCSCAYQSALESGQVIPFEYCDLLTEKDGAFYDVNCVWDLDELLEKNPTTTTTERTPAGEVHLSA